MRSIPTLIFALIALSSCGSSPETSPPDANNSFQLTMSLSLDATIDTAQLGSNSYGPSSTVPVDLQFDSYADAVANRSDVLGVTSGSQSGIVNLIPFCEIMDGTPVSETDTVTVHWEPGTSAPELSGGGTCVTPTTSYGWTD